MAILWERLSVGFHSVRAQTPQPTWAIVFQPIQPLDQTQKEYQYIHLE